MARGSESARSASRLLANAPDVAYGVTPETDGWREGCRRAAIGQEGRAAERGGSVELRRLLRAVR